MSGKMSKKDLDHQFEQFLKESLSDDSLDDGGGRGGHGSVLHKLGQRESKKEEKLWWMEEDEEGSPRLKGSSTNRWLMKKDKKKEENSGKELGGSQEAKFLKSLNKKSPTESPTTGLAANFDNPPAKRDVDVSKDSLEDFFHAGRNKGNNGGRGGVIPEKASFEDTLIDSSGDEAVEDVRTGSAPGTGPGMDTLEELAEKERFFKDLEGKAQGTVDYGRLNEEADLTDTFKQPKSGHKGGEDMETKLDSYSEDFSDESQDSDEERDASVKVTDTGGKTNDGESSKKFTSTPPSKPMLARVALFDTMDSSFGTGKLGKTLLPSGGDTDGDSPQMKTVPTATGTNSDVEALQRALQDAQMSTLGTGTAADLDLGGGTEARGLNLSPAQPRGRGFDLEPAGTKDQGFTLPEENRGFDLQSADDSRKIDLYPSGEKHGFDLQPASEKHGFDLQPASENHGFDLQPASEKHGFDLQPARENHGFDLQPASENHGFDLQPAGENHGFDLQPASENHGFDLSPAHVGQKGFQYDDHDQDLDKTTESKPQTPVPTPRQRKHVGQKFTFESPDQHKTIQDLERDIETQVGRLDRLDDSIVNDRTEQVSRKGKPRKGRQQNQVRSSGYGKVIPSRRTNGSASTPDAKLGKHARDSAVPKTSTPNKQGKTVSFHGQSAKGRTSSASPYRWTPKQVSTFKARGAPIDDSVAGSQLMASVESFAYYIQDHFSPERKGKSSRQAWEDKPPVKSDGPPPGIEHLSREKMLLLQVQDLQKELEVEQKLREKIHADFRAQQREYQREVEELRLQHDKELDQMKQENFVLRAKLGDSEAHDGDEKEAEPSSQKSDSKGKAADQEVERLRQEVKVQEDLLKGYQQENERLYAQLKTGTSKYKETETLLFQENQKLQAEVARLKEEGEERERALLFKGVITSPAAQRQIKAGTADSSMAAARVAYLEKELRKSKLHSEDMLRDVVRLKGEKSQLEQQLDRERALGVKANRQVSELTEVQQLEVRTRVQQYEEEVLELKRKLRWYVENQELVDRQTRVLREKEEEMERLRGQVKRLEAQTGQKQDRGRAKERAADAKRILDLERQVKEMENIIKRRHPNSIPAMILAANAAPPSAPSSPTRPLSVQFLENRIRKLEGELERRDEDAKLSLRALQQTHNQVKLQYEEEISRLGKQLMDRRQMSARVDSNRVSTLEIQLDLERSEHNKMVEEFKREITELHKRLEAAQMRKSMNDNEAFAAQKLEAETLVLKKELKEKSQEIFQLQKTCQKLQSGSGKDGGKFGKTRSVGKKKGAGKDVVPSPRHDVAFPDSLDDRSYEPHAFTGLHISDIQRENETLKQQVESLSFELEQQRVKLQMQVAEAESNVRKAQEASEEQLEVMKVAHQREAEKLLSQYTRQQSTSEVAELTSRLQTRDVMLEHLKSELASAKRDQEELVRVKLREEALQRQLSRLQEELAEAKAQQSPEMRHFESLQSKIQSMEDKYRERERGLQNGVLSPKGGRSDSQWAQIVESKNRQIEQFRAELDSILAVLRQIQQNKMSAGYRIPTI